MSATNYFKITSPNNHSPSSFFPFDEAEEATLVSAWWAAKTLHATLGGVVAAYKPISTLGPWLDVPLVGAGIDGMALEAFKNGSYADDGDDDAN